MHRQAISSGARLLFLGIEQATKGVPLHLFGSISQHNRRQESIGSSQVDLVIESNCDP